MLSYVKQGGARVSLLIALLASIMASLHKLSRNGQISQRFSSKLFEAEGIDTHYNHYVN